jgi:Short C-terminal domain
MFRRRRPLMRAAVVGGVAYHAGKKVQQGREEDEYTQARLEELEAQQAAAAYAPPQPQGMTEAKISQLKELAQLKDAGVLTEAEFEVQKQKLLQS